MKTLRYKIEISFEAANEIDEGDLKKSLAAALSHSTAAEAIQEALFVAHCGDVWMDYWDIDND